jgi:deoxyribose-phosphate aldolase
MEADIVLNRTFLQQEPPDYTAVFKELNALRYLCHSHTLKLILETSQLSRDQIIAGTVLAHHANFNYVKTSTGFCGRGASVEDVRLMRSVAHRLHKLAPNGQGRPLFVKASGGIRTYRDVLEMVKAGADRIGASAGVAIVEQARSGDDQKAREQDSAKESY